MKKNSSESLYLYKQCATTHIENKKYSWAVVYLEDGLKTFQEVIEQIQNQDEMEKLIRQIKIPCHKNLSLCYLKQGNYQNSIRQCKQVLDLQPNCIKILYRIGVAYLSLNNLTEAENYLRRAYLLDPSEKEVMKALERIQSQSNRSKIKEPKQTESSLSILVRIIKFFLFWPFYVIQFLWDLITGNAKKS